jgi:hypothetical protein
MITQHTIRSIIAPSVDALIRADPHSSGNPTNPPIPVHKNLKLRFHYYRILINKLYASNPKTPKK